MTEWGDYQRPEFKEMFQRMKSPVIFDGRNLYEPWAMERLGFTYHSIGRPSGRVSRSREPSGTWCCSARSTYFPILLTPIPLAAYA